jgi:hypothetical protein
MPKHEDLSTLQATLRQMLIFHQNVFRYRMLFLCVQRSVKHRTPLFKSLCYRLQ